MTPGISSVGPLPLAVAEPVAYALASVALVSAIALVGVSILALSKRRMHVLLTYLVSFAAGTLFGNAFLHLVPETAETYGFGLQAGSYLLSGIVLAYAVETYVSWHHGHHPHEEHPSSFSYMILFGDAIHNFIDGVILTASYLVSIPLGIATTVAIAFHEIPQEIGDFGVLVYGGFSPARALAYNLASALVAFVGAGVVIALAGEVDGLTRVILPVAAGNFVYVAGSDLLPELREQSSDVASSTAQMATFLAGIGVLYLLAL